MTIEFSGSVKFVIDVVAILSCLTKTFCGKRNFQVNI